MTRRAGSIIAVLCAVATLGGPVAAQYPSPPTVGIERLAPADRAKVPADRANAPTPAQQLAFLIPAGGTLAQFREQLRALFYQADADGDGVLTEADESLHRAVTTAAGVAAGVTQIMIADLDGDGFVTEAELRLKLKYDQQMASLLGPPSAQGAGDPDRRIQQEVARLMAADVNRDGRISWTEAGAFARRQTDHGRNVAVGVEWPVKAFRALVPGKDRIALADVDGLAEAVFGEIDADHNGTVLARELAAWQARHNR